MVYLSICLYNLYYAIFLFIQSVDRTCFGRFEIHVRNFTQVDHTQCDQPCPGNAMAICGGLEGVYKLHNLGKYMQLNRSLLL